MTPSEFLSEASSFAPGSFVVVSGDDRPMLGVLMSGAQMVIEGGGKTALLYDSRDTETQQVAKYQSCGAKFPEDDCGPSYHQVGIPWESKVLLASGSVITLVANYLDLGNPWMNVWKVGLPADTVIDLLEWYNVRSITDSDSKKFSNVRALNSFVTRLYWYDGGAGQVTRIKDQTPELPSNIKPPVISGVNSPVGPAIGKQLVTVKGENFYPGAKVSFDGRVATDVIVVNENEITCLTPSHPEGTSNVEVSTQFGLAILSSGFYFVAS